MNYKLKVTETKNKAGKFHYQVIDENGAVVSERKSNREYVAATSNGSHYFGRVDLIGKGDHGRSLKYWESVLNDPKRREFATGAVEALGSIAHLEN